ncbi:pre-mRNA-splicing factor syf2 isoform X2 [Nematostella vectensis]|uniref:pre-mRNA-splicing factor syf2 isoform X2 n=1 Tax=Nematostella vectensis TaxID=45351 RepID=UPI002077831C|nr:pre-mRNA-splicing factor syf2 isoform X2 [Nematostella vectensis]
MASTQDDDQVAETSRNSSEDGEVGETTSTASSTSSSKSAAEKRAERMKRLQQLHLRRNEARKMNHQEVVEEDRKKKLPANWEAKQRRVEWEQQDDEAAEAKGEDFERVKMLSMTADEAERLERKKKKRNPDQGFADFAQAQQRQYSRLTKQLKPDMSEYKKQKDELGEAFTPSVDNLSYGGEGKVSEAGIDRMVADLEKQAEKRAKFSRRRAHYDDADIDYINERNMKFNKKLARFYDPFTAEIKQNLERGTAV